MRLLRFTAEGFGRWTGEARFDPERLNVVIGENEAGKTTLGVAIVAALYGLDADRRRYVDRLSPHEQYEPWGGEPYAIELEFEIGNKRYTVNRQLSRGAVSVYQAGKGDVTEEFRTGKGEYAVGDILLGMRVEQFVRSALWLQPGPQNLGGGDVRPDAKLTTLLENHASTVSGDASAHRAVQVLKEALAKYEIGESRVMVGTQIKRLETLLEKRRGELGELERRRDQAGLALGDLARCREDEAVLTRQSEEIERRLAVARARELEAQLRRDDEVRARVDAARAERSALADLAEIPADAADRLRRVHAERKVAEETLAELARRRREKIEDPRAELAARRRETEALAWAAPVHVEELRKTGGDLVRAAEQVRGALERHREVEGELERLGIRRSRVEELRARFQRLPVSDEALLTNAPSQAQAWAGESEKARRTAEESASALRAIDRERGTRRVGGWTAALAGAGAGAGAVALALRAQTATSVAALVATVVLLAVGILLLLRAQAHRASEREPALRALTQSRRRLQELKDQAAERSLALSDLARRLGIPDADDLLLEYAEFLRVTREAERLDWVAQDLDRLRGDEQTLRATARDWAARAGLDAPAAGGPPPSEWDALGAIETVTHAVERRLECQRDMDRLDVAERDLAGLEVAQRARLQAAVEAAREVVRALGTPEEDWDRAATELEGRRQQLERRRALDRELPEWERRLLPPATREAHSAELEHLRAEPEVARALREAGGIERDGATEHADAVRRRGEVEAARERIRSKRIELERSVGWLEDERHVGEAADLRLRIAEIEREILQATRFQKSASLAVARLESVARETNARWSEFISTRVRELLPHLGPALRGFEVTDDLGFSVVLAGQRREREKVEQSLSAGARDQLGLALRLAICEYLSRGGESLPLVLDDPFATSDDARAASGMRFLAGTIVPSHQTILLTCHHGRVEALRDEDPGWYAKHVHEIRVPAPGVPRPATIPPREPGSASALPSLFAPDPS